MNGINLKIFLGGIMVFLWKHRSKKIIRILKVKTPLKIKKIALSLIFKKEIKNAEYIYSLLNNWRYENSEMLNFIKNYQNQKLLYIFQYAYKFSPYYKKLFDKNNINIRNLDDFYKIPLLNKEIIRKNKDQLICSNIYKIRFTNANTGGSTGEPLDFLVSYLMGYIDHAHQRFQFEIMGYKEGDKISVFVGIALPNYLRKKNIYWMKLNNQELPYGGLWYSSLYFNENTAKYYIEHLLNSKPSILRAYPSFINDIANYILDKNIKIDFSIKGIQLTAEIAFDWQVKNIKKAFKCDVFFQYGHTEMCVFGFTTDEKYGYLCSPFYGLTEIIDSEGRHVKKGETGEIVATSFFNTALPFIRYRTGDFALFDGNENGAVKLKRIEGRTQDFIYNKNGEKISITALIFGLHYKAFKNIKKWQVRQDKPGRATINIIKEKKFSKKDAKEIINNFKNIANIDAQLNFVDNIELTKTGKFRFVVVE